jgi:recombinational DNA repair protein RecR
LQRPAPRNAWIRILEELKDVVTIEKTREFHGPWHVPGSTISLIDASSPGICLFARSPRPRAEEQKEVAAEFGSVRL